MSNLKYRIKFQITNLSKEELRDFKIKMIQSDYVLEFESDTIPRIPNKSEIIRINDRAFKMEDYEIHYVTENGQVYNVFNIFIYDFEVKDRQEREQKSKDLMKKLSELSKFGKAYKEWYDV